MFIFDQRPCRVLIRHLIISRRINKEIAVTARGVMFFAAFISATCYGAWKTRLTLCNQDRTSRADPVNAADKNRVETMWSNYT